MVKSNKKKSIVFFARNSMCKSFPGYFFNLKYIKTVTLPIITYKSNKEKLNSILQDR